MNKTRQHFIFFWEINALLTTAGSQATLRLGLSTHTHTNCIVMCVEKRAENDSPVYGTIWPGPR